MITEPISIRRYPNRRFYDRSRRRYVTLQDIEDLVLDGRTIEVRDSRTGEDLTRQILAQLLLERHPEKMAMFPVAMLHSILQANDLATDFWRGYLRQSLTMLDGLRKATPLAWMSSLAPGILPQSTPPTAEAEALARRVAELESRLERIELGAEEPAESPPEQRDAVGPSPRRNRRPRVREE
ncbi:MAG TPA: polyhydroxyalkanoate synthesis regulator DNA-binding domain-containing protein [Isosphaeraceae bacterium]|jgi:polyhydroxyalkanoate synthesis repressor PhaR